ncbi:hypothetical protein BH10BDE1_BH10BDE1_32760 [soil metagenome]
MLALFLALAGFVSVARAQNTNPTPTPTPLVLPVVQRNAGQPVTITWADGREATLEVTATISERAALPMGINENSCEPSQRVQCEYRSGLSVETYRLAWTKHSDAAKLEKTVSTGISSDPRRNPLIMQATWTRVDNVLFPGLQQEALADEISCPSWKWLGQGPTLPASLTIPSISTEFMLPNPNTNQVENKTIMTATDIVWEKTETDALRMKTMGRFDAYISLGINALFVGDVMRWSIEKSQNRYCDVGFKVDIGLLRVAYQGILDRSLKGPYVTFNYVGEEPYKASVIGSVLDLRPDLFNELMVYE